MAASHVILTEAEFDGLAEEPGLVRELVDGELIEMASPTPLHQHILLQIGRTISDLLESHGKGRAFPQLDFRLRPGLRLQPDVCVLFADALRNFDYKKTPVNGCPDIAIEIISPSETTTYTNAKRKAYLEAGVKEVWQIDPENGEAIIWDPLPRYTDTLTSALLPGFEIRLAALLEVPS